MATTLMPVSEAEARTVAAQTLWSQKLAARSAGQAFYTAAIHCAAVAASLLDQGLTDRAREYARAHSLLMARYRRAAVRVERVAS